MIANGPCFFIFTLANLSIKSSNGMLWHWYTHYKNKNSLSYNSNLLRIFSDQAIINILFFAMNNKFLKIAKLPNLINRTKRSQKSLLKFKHYSASGCGTGGRAVTSKPRGPRFESTNRQLLFALLTALIGKVK